ncbi:hypothetical protein KPB07_36030, partial [Burkholderia cenocepacia]|nr:hypothetical protein [Burkholderia cenocepacia]
FVTRETVGARLVRAQPRDELRAVQHQLCIDRAERRQRQRQARAPRDAVARVVVPAAARRTVAGLVGFDRPVKPRAGPRLAGPAKLSVASASSCCR